MVEASGKLNGFKPRSYGDIVAVAALLTMFISVVAWGLKLEGELNQVRNQVMILTAQVSRGILPRAEERIRALERELDDLKEQVNNEH